MKMKIRALLPDLEKMEIRWCVLYKDEWIIFLKTGEKFSLTKDYIQRYFSKKKNALKAYDKFITKLYELSTGQAG